VQGINKKEEVQSKSPSQKLPFICFFKQFFSQRTFSRVLTQPMMAKPGNRPMKKRTIKDFNKDFDNW
jgi:hypothetical protein